MARFPRSRGCAEALGLVNKNPRLEPHADAGEDTVGSVVRKKTGPPLFCPRQLCDVHQISTSSEAPDSSSARQR